MRATTPLLFVLACVAVVGGLFFVGWMSPVMYPDSHGYLRAAESSNPWGHERHPFYGWIVLWLQGLGIGQDLVPWLQIGLQCAAALALMTAARLYGMDRWSSLSLGIAAVLGQVVVIWGAALLPELPSVSLMVLSLALVLLATRERLFWPAALLLGVVLGASYTLRPIMMPAIILLPLLYLLLARMDSQGWRGVRAIAMVAILVLPAILQSSHRYRAVGDFGLVSFAGIGSMGATAQFLTPDILPRLPEPLHPLAEQVLAAKQRAVDAQTAMPLFRNSRGERSFMTTALDGFDMMARNHDEILWGQLVKLQGETESWVAFNARMEELSRAIVRAAPERQLFWMAGASGRIVGRIFAYNVAFLLALAAFAIAALWNISRHGTALGGASGRSWTPLTLIVGTWVVVTVGLSAIVGFPALRYTDTASLLVTALPLYGLFLAIVKPTKSA